MARARAKVSRLQSWATVIGARNSPKIERTPKPTVAIRQPATMTITGVRQRCGRVLETVIHSLVCRKAPSEQISAGCYFAIVAGSAADAVVHDGLADIVPALVGGCRQLRNLQALLSDCEDPVSGLLHTVGSPSG